MSSDETIQQRRQRLSQVPRACEACKIRKVRCDRTVPCSNCQVSGITCKNAHRATPRATTPRANQSPAGGADLQRELDTLRARMNELERQVAGQTDASSQASSTQPSPYVSSTPSHDPVYEGPSSLNSQALGARDIAQASGGPNAGSDQTNLAESLADLASLLQPDGRISSTDDCQFTAQPGSRPMPELKTMPPDLVAAVCRRARERHSVFLSSYLINDIDVFEDLCRRIYFPASPVSLGEVTMMHGILAYLLREHVAFQEAEPTGYDLKHQIHQCDGNFNLGIETFDVMAIPTFENTFALALGVMKAQGLSKPTLCCSLLSAAISHCRVLGYTKESTYRHLPAKRSQSIRRVFWTLYTFDKNISLMQGRPSYLQDVEIDAETPDLSTDPAVRPWDESFLMAISFARIQGRICAHYCARDRENEDIPERDPRVHERLRDLQDWYSAFRRIDYTNVNNPQVFRLSRLHWDVVYHAATTMVMRPLVFSDGTGEIGPVSFQAARLCLEAHVACFNGFTGQAGVKVSEVDYADWFLHLSSFTPFVIVFLHAVSAESNDDLKLLNRVVATLRQTRRVSRATDRLFRICDALARVAKVLVKSPDAEWEGGFYGETRDSLSFLDGLGQIVVHGGQGLSGPQTPGGSFIEGVGDLADFLNDWGAGVSPWMAFAGNGE